MIKSSSFIIRVMSLIFVLSSTGCNSSENNATNGTANPESADSMPVVRPHTTDSGSIMTTPPVNDNNVVNPDTTQKNQ
jgi:hypothetical protein